MPLAPQCEAYLYINGLPGIQPGTFDSTTVKAFSQITLGIAQVVQVPVRTRIVVPAEFDLETCLIILLPTYITFPTDIAGEPINPPIVPTIPGLAQLPGFRPILQALIPAIGNLYNV
ncbi:hypothetical protein AC579_9796 [Pseudocercospora musae]|uniref:Uncharacterized protein n=1 Tax=Pseudocercospora musae TaxID=113226 RepID=A0A139IVB2_9PEZI|nr:hypothetical protein AC579_9796 [Pseudocercospora musae]KXT18581.1 hypothetical protein AC579_9796 [Pseudocercospora musae]